MNDSRPTLHILATLDGSDQAESALRFARSIAAGAAEITVLRVVSDQETIFDTSGMLVIPSQDEFSVQLDRAEHESRNSVAKFDDQLGTTWRVESRLGEPAGTIVDFAEERRVDLVVMSSTGKGAFARLTLGSVADRVARTSTVPVLFVRASNEATIKRLIVPTDGSILADAAIPEAIDLAHRLGAPIEFLYVADYSKVVSGGLGAAALTPELYGELLSGTTHLGQEIVNQSVSAAQAAGVPATGKVLRGIPAQAIHDEGRADDLIVMSSHGRSGFTRWLIGSVAEKLVRAGSSPVMLVPTRKPASVEAFNVTI